MKNGFTLIEILVALAIFAIITVLTTTLMYQVFNTRTRLAKQSDQLNDLQIVLSLLKQDTEQITNRPIRIEEKRLMPGFVGFHDYVEFTRNGITNPQSQIKQSNLKRIAYLCYNDKLLRLSWPSLDPLNHSVFAKRVLLSNLSFCKFAYLNYPLQVLSEWRENAMRQNQQAEPLPKAIQFTFARPKKPKSTLLFIIPEALYAGK